MKLAVVVSSCDHFENCWEPFIFGFRKYWPDCPYPVYIISNFKELADETVRFIKVGEDRAWATNLRTAVEQIDAEYILYMQEDYWLNAPVDTAFFEQQLRYCDEQRVDHLRLSQPFMDQYRIDDTHALSPAEKEKYAFALQTIIWRRSTLLEMVVDGWTGWDFEAKICRYVVEKGIKCRAEVLLSSCEPQYTFNYPDGTGVRKGRWTVAGYRYLIDNGFEKLARTRTTEGPVLDYWNHFRGRHEQCWLLRGLASAIIRTMNKYKWNF